ncbi:MAG: hypothetical protein AAFU61_17920, partial [Pseudomonadota bacterium]
MTIFLDSPFSLVELDHLLIEIAEDGSDDPGRATAPGAASIYYQHVYDRRTIGWHSTAPPEDAYPFSASVPSTVPYTNMTFGQRLPMVQFCVFPLACPSQALVEVTTATEALDEACAAALRDDDDWTLGYTAS